MCEDGGEAVVFVEAGEGTGGELGSGLVRLYGGRGRTGRTYLERLV